MSGVTVRSEGVISAISKNDINSQNLELYGGAILIETDGSFNTNKNISLDSKGSDLLKNDQNLINIDGDLIIQSNNSLTIDPRIHQLSAIGDIELISKNGSLNLLGYGGNNGKGSEEIIKINTIGGGVRLQGEEVLVQGSDIQAKDSVKIISTNGDVEISAVKNNIINTHSQLYKDKTQDVINNHNYNINQFNGILNLALTGSQTMQIMLAILGGEEGVKNLIAESNNEINLQIENLNFYNSPLNGFEHKGSKIESTHGDLEINAEKGILIRAAEIDVGQVSIESNGTLTKSRTSKDVEHQVDAGILIDGLIDSYELGNETDANYSVRENFSGTQIRSTKNINIKSTGDSSTDNLIIQAAYLKNNTADIDLQSKKDIVLLSAQDQSYDRSTSTTTKRSWYGKKKAVTTTSNDQSYASIPTSLNSKNIYIKSLGDSVFYSTELNADKQFGGEIDIQAKNIKLLVTDEFNKQETDVRKKSSFLGLKYNDSTTNSSYKSINEIPVKATADYINTYSDFNTLIQGAEFNYLSDASITAGGVITLEPATSRIEEAIKKESNSVVWQSMQDKGSIAETAKLPSFNGPTPPNFKAEGGIEVQIPIGEQDQNKVQIKDEIIKLANQSGNEYLNELIKRDDVDWNKVILTQQDWDYKSQGLTGAGAALVVIIVTALTAGAGTAAAGAVGGGVIGAGAQAAVATLASQASVSLINNGGDIAKTLKDLGSKDSVKGLITSVVTAGLLSEVGVALNIKPDSTVFSDRLIKNFTDSVGSTLVQTAINGGNLKDNLEAALLSGFAGALQGEFAQNIKVLEDVNYIVHKIAHAAAGCIAGEIQRSCEAGAIGAAVGEIAAGLVPRNEDMTAQEIDIYNQKVINTSKLIAGTVSAYTGYDVNIAANSAETAVKNNFLYPKEKMKYEAEYAGCSLSGDSSSCRDQVIEKYMNLSKQNDQILFDTCTNGIMASACNSMLKVALNYSSSDFWYSYVPTTSAALNDLKKDQIRTRDLVLSKIIENPDSFYKAVNDIDTRADFFSAMYLKTGATWFLAAEKTSRNNLSGILFNMGSVYDQAFQTIRDINKMDQQTQTTLLKWRSEAGDAIMKLGYADFKNVYQNYKTIDLKQWSIQRLVDEQVALQPIHEKYVPKLSPSLRTVMQGVGNVTDLLNVQDRINTGCEAMGYTVQCGVAK